MQSTTVLARLLYCLLRFRRSIARVVAASFVLVQVLDVVLNRDVHQFAVGVEGSTLEVSSTLAACAAA